MNAIQLLESQGIGFAQLTEKEIYDYKKSWVRQFIPEEKWQKAKDYYCVPSDGGCSDYLWHAFSFGLLNALIGDEARRGFCEIQVKEVILLSNWDGKGFLISDATGLTPLEIDKFDDVVLTSADFMWTYAKPHESDLGPYFYRVGS